MQFKISYILLLFLSVAFYGQVDVRLKTERRDYSGNEIIDLVIVIEMDGSQLDKPLQLPDFSKFHIVGSSTSQSVMGVGPDIVTQVIHRFALEPKVPGKIRIGSALATVDNKIYKSEPFDIYIKDVPKKAMAQQVNRDVFLNLSIEDKEVYEEQATVAVLTAYSKNLDNLRKVDNIKLPQGNTFNVSPISFERSEIDPTGFANMSSQVVAVFAVFPTRYGFVEVPPVTATLHTNASEKKIASNPLKLQVKRLPENAPTGFKNAVGDFKMSVSTPVEDNIEVEKPFNVSIKVTGVGNMNNMILPALRPSPAYDFFPPKITSKIVSSEEGDKGEIIANYLVIPKKHGDILISTEDFTYFNPEKLEYITEEGKGIQVLSLTQQEVLNARTAVERVNDYSNDVLETVNTPIIKTNTLKIKEKDKIDWKIIVLNVGIVLIFIFTFLFYNRWQRNRFAKETYEKDHSLGTIAETEVALKQVLKADVEDFYTYLHIQLQESNYDQFFEIVNELDQEVKNQYFLNSDQSFVDVLTNFKGKSVAERYSLLEKEIQIAKYSPVKSSDDLQDLLHSIKEVYGQISK